MSGPVILYVEDEPDDLLFFREAMRATGVRAELQEASDARGAMAYLLKAEPPPRIAIIDVNLPLISGFDLLRWIRARPETRDLVVVMFSSSGRPEDRELAGRLGAQEYVQKPVSGMEFRDVLRRLNERWLSPPNEGATPAERG